MIHGPQRPGIAPNMVYAHDWEECDFVIFHNRVLIHSVVGAFAENEFRVFRQCNIVGSKLPTGPQDITASGRKGYTGYKCCCDLSWGKYGYLGKNRRLDKNVRLLVYSDYLISFMMHAFFILISAIAFYGSMTLSRLRIPKVPIHIENNSHRTLKYKLKFYIYILNNVRTLHFHCMECQPGEPSFYDT